MAEIQIRMASSEDAAIIAHHRNQMFADMGHGTAQSRTQMDMNFDIWLRQQIEAEAYLGWFACDGEAVIAGVGMWLIDWIPGIDGFAGRLPYLLNVYTEPDYRKQGLARCLVNESIRYCREHGYPKMRLHASIYGRPLYEQFGFVDNNEMQLVFEV